MENFKRYITILVAAFMAMGIPLTAHAAVDPSDNSATAIPAEGNGNCNDYAENGVIMSIPTNIPGTGTASDGTVSVDYTVNDDLTELSFDSTIAIDFVTVKERRTVGVFFYPSGGVTSDSGINLGGSTFSSVEFCYGLGNEPAPPVNTAPELAEIPDQEGLVDDVISFSVSATDDGLPATPGSLSISVDTLSAYFTDNGDGTGDFSWTATTGGSTDITFTVTDGELSDSQTVAITVNEPLQTASCEYLSSGDPDGDALDETGVSCPTDGSRALVCNLQLDEPFYGLNIEDHCCVCNQDGLGSVSPLIECNPEIPAGGDPINGVESCFTECADIPAGETTTDGIPSCADVKPHPLEVTTHLEFNNDPYYCYTSGGRRICYAY